MSDSVSDSVEQPITVKLGEKEFTVSPLALVDLAKAEVHLREQRLNQFLETTRMVRGVDLPDKVRSDSIAAIMNHTIGLDEVMSSFEGGLFLLFLSLQKTTPSLQMANMQALEPLMLKDLTSIMYKVTGLIAPEEEGEVPLEEKTTPPTSIDEMSIKTFQGGESTSQD